MTLSPRFAILWLVSLALFVAGGCATSSPRVRVSYKKMYPGPTLGTNAIAIIYNDVNSGVYIEKTRGGLRNKVVQSIGVLPGKQTFTFGYYQSVYNGYYSSTKPFYLTETVEAGHKYQVVGFSTSFLLSLEPSNSLSGLPGIGNSFSASLVDITTPADVWKYYEQAVNDDHRILAVGRIEDQTKLQEVAKNSPKPLVRSAAVKKITDAKFLNPLLDEEIDANVRAVIKARLRALAPSPSL